jgi:outer membrane protein
MLYKKLILMKTILLTSMLSFVAFFAQAQKFAYVDSDYILKNIPSYQDAQKALDELSVKWQNQIEAKYSLKLTKCTKPTKQSKFY